MENDKNLHPEENSAEESLDTGFSSLPQDDLLTPENQKWLDEILGKAQQACNLESEENTEKQTLENSEESQDLALEKILQENFDAAPGEMGTAVEKTQAIPSQIEKSDLHTKDSHMDATRMVDTGPLLHTESVPAPKPPVPAKPKAPKPSAPQSQQPPVKKGRPKRKKGYGLLGIPHMLATAVWIALIVVIGVSLGRTIWVCTADLMAFGKPNHQVTITISNTDTIKTVAQKLSDAKLIRYPGLFETFATLTGKDERISAGTFTLNSQLDYNAMINAMGYYAPAREEVEVIIPEGYNCAMIFKHLEKEKVCSAKDLEEWAAEGDLKEYWFLKDVKRGDKYCLEGFLAPDTYKFYTNDTPQRVLEKLLNEFEDRFTEKMKDKYEALKERYNSNLLSHGKDQAYLDAHPLDLNTIVTLASIIERETSSGDESFEIASVFFNRLTNPDNYPHLESKATVHYAIGDYFGEIPKLTQEHLDTVSPYNTFTCEGLPAGPICNPSVNSIYAALDPNETDYYYYVFDKKENKHRFASSADGHARNVAEVEAAGE